MGYMTKIIKFSDRSTIHRLIDGGFHLSFDDVYVEVNSSSATINGTVIPLDEKQLRALINKLDEIKTERDLAILDNL
jgi:hypothetical protein